MEILYLIAGIIIGLLLAIFTALVVRATMKTDTLLPPQIMPDFLKQKATFLEPISDKERWDNAENVSDLLN